MKLEPDDGTTGLSPRYVSDDGKIEVGVYPVMFGVRVRAGYVGLGVCELDWCCGTNRVFLEGLLGALKKHIQANPKNPFEGLPTISQIKPAYNDPDFMKAINKKFYGKH